MDNTRRTGNPARIVGIALSIFWGAGMGGGLGAVIGGVLGLILGATVSVSTGIVIGASVLGLGIVCGGGFSFWAVRRAARSVSRRSEAV
ncbi:hypothetical protein BKA00_004225 [Actinomadura coerulea]|uniref:Uncharacterized protein n=1 Tax=Actinomadura coerulea TaxID=46159 RepID=A0A7X0G0W5_9ACTN|nr:hypothetical protein [Actinomadura coerulea]MBB6397311.1 hypothetical protein [Actinomadura coerulea]GGQ01810.1 hypothetical protein GCM10010187_16780 [Actinomadura coerulea]